MRTITCTILAAALTIGAAGVASAKDMPGMPISAPTAATHGQGAGVIRAIDPAAGTLTIQHGPIPSVGWPAMTMAFKASPEIPSS